MNDFQTKAITPTRPIFFFTFRTNERKIVTACHNGFPGRIDFPIKFSAEIFSRPKFFSAKNFFGRKLFLSVEKSNVGNHPKRVFPNSQAKRITPGGVNPPSKFCKNQKIVHVFGVKKANVGNRLKRVFPNSQAKRSHPRGVNVRSKFAKFRSKIFYTASCNF